MDDDEETGNFVEGMMRRIMAISPTTDRGRSDRTMRRIKSRLENDFPVGCRVRMSPLGAENFPRYVGKSGEVIGYEHGVSPKVRFDGNKTASGWHPDFLEHLPQS